MNLKRFHSFVIVAEECNVGRAARRLRIAQPALTRQLQALEQEIGAKLLERHPRGVRLTPAGSAFLEHAQRAVAAAEAGVRSARDAAARTRTTVLRISPPDWPNRARQVQRAVEGFRKVTPDVDIEYDLTPWVLHADALLDGATDVGFGIAMNAADYGPKISAHRLLDEPASSAVLPKTHPLAMRTSLVLRDLRDIPLLVPPRECAPILHEQMVGTVRSGGFEPRVVPAPPSFALAVQIIVAGAGWTITTHSVGEEPPHGVAVIPIEDARVMLGFYALHRASDDRESVREFVRQVQLAIAPIAG
jgi:DNA-binding transcriptional LysR family regulator